VEVCRERLTQLTQEVQTDLSLLSLGGMLPPASEGTTDSNGKNVFQVLWRMMLMKARDGVVDPSYGILTHVKRTKR
jgi:hypothetical protein